MQAERHQITLYSKFRLILYFKHTYLNFANRETEKSAKVNQDCRLKLKKAYI